MINIKFFLLCPIPEDQKPINEYIGLKENPLTNWTTLSKKQYERKLISLFSGSFLFFCFLNFSEFEFVENWFVETLLWSTLFFVSFCFLLIFRWSQVMNRFTDSRLFYEESSWYDGQIWEKPLMIIKNDRLIATQKIQPILNRLKRTTYFFSYISFLLVFFLNF
jgi:hypothetical protein